MKNAIQKGFPPTVSFPPELALLCDWQSENGYPISGDFELRADDGEAIYWWFRSHAADDRLAQFGAGPDGSLYCVWKQDDGRESIVHMGSEGDELKVLAGNMKDFITLLAIGYGEVGFEDLSEPPAEGEGINPKFRGWAERTFKVSIPATGKEITERARLEHDDFQAFVAAVTAKDE
ncbi:hypothetical protein BH09VER1_BH09VER1_03260 [soil metagenome]